MEKNDIINLYNKAKEIGIALCEWSNPERFFRSIQIDEHGDFEVHFEEYRCGDTDYDSVYITLEELMSDSTLVISNRKQMRIEEVNKIKLEKIENDRIAQEQKEKDKLEKDKKEFERLKKIFS